MNSFYTPKNLSELSNCLAKKDDNTFIVAGGTDLAIHINENKLSDYNLIDITNIKQLQEIEQTNDEIIVGAATKITDIAQNDVCNKYLLALIDACNSLGSTQIRNRATVGGNISNASQCADTMPVAFCYNAKCQIINSKNEIREVLAQDFILGIGKTALAKDEALIKIIFEKSHDISAFDKVGARKTVTISKINCCARLDLENNIIKNSIIYMGSIGIKPIRASFIETAIQGLNINDNISTKIKYEIRNEVIEAIPTRSSRFYKKEAAIGVIDDVLNKIKERYI